MKKSRFGVIASIVEPTAPRLVHALSKTLHAQTCEIRLDCLNPYKINHVLAGLPSLISMPTILTLRSKEQGGSEVIPLEEQLNFWRTLPKNLCELINRSTSEVFVDWSLDLVQHCSDHEPPFPWSKIGCSWHDFQKTPENLPAILKNLEATKAMAFLKLVTMATREEDLQSLRALFENRQDERPLIAFAMGEIGESSRRECLGWGSAGTYGYIPGHQKAAPGQLSITELLEDPYVQEALKL